MALSYKFLIGIISISTSSLVFFNQSIDLGKIRTSEKREIIFKIMNTSNKNIRIYSVSSSCGCTIPKYPTVLISKKTTYVNAIFDPKGFKGDIKKDLVLVVEDSQKYYKLSFTAFVE
ncbi:MAG: DUF1573 domain-containing protein [Sediminibacterium sp.]|nr:DUF1573 domain-containing protein [Sediminibacterium sp.]